MIAPGDLEHCRAAIRTGSLSFHAASRLLPARVRDPALVLYAFCRLADDEVDLKEDKAASVLRLRDRLDAVYEGRPRNAPVDRAFAALVETWEMPRALPEALLEGLAWDAMGRRYEDEAALMAYCARVASAVGVMMCVLMKVRDADALSRACDLGLAMQMTNIARDIGEDARAGRLYLPLEWLEDEGVAPEDFLAAPAPTGPIRTLTRRLLSRAEDRYFIAAAGIGALPLDCRPGIAAARLIYRGIGGEVAKAGHDSVTRRAHTSKGRKLAWLAQAGAHAAWTAITPNSAVLLRKPHPETAFLVEAARREAPAARGRVDALIDVLAQLEARDRARRGGAMDGGAGAT